MGKTSGPCSPLLSPVDPSLASLQVKPKGAFLGVQNEDLELPENTCRVYDRRKFSMNIEKSLQLKQSIIQKKQIKIQIIETINNHRQSYWISLIIEVSQIKAQMSL